MKIRIFVSKRIDVTSLNIKNSLYFPVLCGGIFSDSKCNNIFYDDTGINISTKRSSFCEFTVQYWAWKNFEEDYYGLCHYRRFLTFTEKIFKTDSLGVIQEMFLDSVTIKKYDLDNEFCMKQTIIANDVIVNQSADVTKIPTPRGFQKTVYDHWIAHDRVFLDKRVLPIFTEVIQRRFPEYYEAATEYLHGKWHRGYNCYVMRRDLFQNMCEFQFGVMFEMEKILANTTYTKGFERTIGYLGEIMYGIYIYYLQKQHTYRIKEVQLVYFEQTEIPDSLPQYYMQKALCWMKIHFEGIGYVLLPKASKRRNFIKKIYFRLTKKNK